MGKEDGKEMKDEDHVNNKEGRFTWLQIICEHPGKGLECICKTPPPPGARQLFIFSPDARLD